jgi:hypothetical protein
VQDIAEPTKFLAKVPPICEHPWSISLPLVSPGPPPLLYPLCHDPAHLLTPLLDFILQWIEQYIDDRSIPCARTSPVDPLPFLWKRISMMITQSSSL